MDSQQPTYQQLLAEVYEETAPNTLIYAREIDGDEHAEPYNEDDFDENDIDEKDEFKKFPGARNKPEHVVKPKPKEDNIGKASFNIDKHIRTYGINIDGRFRAAILPLSIGGCGSIPPNTAPASNSGEFLFRSSRLYKNIFSVKVTSLEFFNSFYTFTNARGNTSFTITDLGTNVNSPTSNGVTVNINIPEGNYIISDPAINTSPNNLLLVLNNAISRSVSNGMINIAFDTITNLVQFISLTGGNVFRITFPSTTDCAYGNGIGYNLGFTKTSYTSAFSGGFGLKIIADAFPDAVQDTYIYLVLNDWTIITHQNSDQTEFGAFMKIPITVSKNTIQNISNSSNTTLNEYFFHQPSNFQSLIVQMKDSFNKTLDMRNSTFSLTLEIQEVLQSDIYEKMLELQ
jgi:hypothetical protein